MSRHYSTHYIEQSIRQVFPGRPWQTLFLLTFILTFSTFSKTAYGFHSVLFRPEPNLNRTAFEPPDDGEPRDTVGAGSRDLDTCDAVTSIAQPLVTENQYGLTFQSHPTIFVKIASTLAQQAILTFKDESGTYHEQAFLPVDVNGEVAQFTLPEAAQPLKTGESYHWSLVLLCGSATSPNNLTLQGWVQRVSLSKNLQSHLRQLSVSEQIHWYNSYGYWYDMWTTLNRAYIERPQDTVVSRLWEQMLRPND